MERLQSDTDVNKYRSISSIWNNENQRDMSFDNSVSIENLAHSMQNHLLSNTPDFDSHMPTAKSRTVAKPPRPLGTSNGLGGGLKSNLHGRVSSSTLPSSEEGREEVGINRTVLPTDAYIDQQMSSKPSTSHLKISPASDMNANEYCEETVQPSARLTTPFYEQLRKKYPKAFRRRTSMGSVCSDTDSTCSDIQTLASPGRGYTDSHSVIDSPYKLVSDLISSPKSNLVGRSAFGNLQGILKNGSQYSSCASIQSDMAGSAGCERLRPSHSTISLKDRLQQNQDSFKKLLSDGPSANRRLYNKGRRASNSSESQPHKMTSAVSSPDLFSKQLYIATALSSQEPADNKPLDPHSLLSHKPPLMVPTSKRLPPEASYSSPVSSRDSEVEDSIPSHQPRSPEESLPPALSRHSRQRSRASKDTSHRAARSRTPKLKSARATQPVQAVLSPAISHASQHNGLGSGGGSGGVNKREKDLSKSSASDEVDSSSSGIRGNDGTCSDPTPQTPPVNPDISPTDVSPKLQQSSHVEKHSKPLSSETSHKRSQPETLPSDYIQPAANSYPYKTTSNGDQVTVSSRKPPMSQSKSKTSKLKCKNLETDPANNTALTAGQVEAYKRRPSPKEKKSILPWKRNKGRYTPCEELERVVSDSSLVTPHLNTPVRTSLGESHTNSCEAESAYEEICVIDAGREEVESVYETVEMVGRRSVAAKQSKPSHHSKTRPKSHDADTYAKVDLTKKPPKTPKNKSDRSSYDDDCASDPPVPTKSASSNLEESQSLGGSKSSLTERVGSFKDSAKRQFGKLRRAMSLERLEKRGGNGDELDSATEAAGKLKKSPSMRSLSEFIKGKKSKDKKERVSRRNEEEAVDGSATEAGHSRKPPRAPQGSVRKSSRGSTISLASNSVETPQHFRSIGKLKAIHADGTQTMLMHRPEKGHVGFYIARGNAKYKHGIFVSQLSEAIPEHFLTGLLSVGDEILEVNGRRVSELPLDVVYDLMAQGENLVLKTLPLAARRDENLV